MNCPKCQATDFMKYGNINNVQRAINVKTVNANTHARHPVDIHPNKSGSLWCYIVMAFQ